MSATTLLISELAIRIYNSKLTKTRESSIRIMLFWVGKSRKVKRFRIKSLQSRPIFGTNKIS